MILEAPKKDIFSYRQNFVENIYQSPLVLRFQFYRVFLFASKVSRPLDWSNILIQLKRTAHQFL